MPLYLAAHRVEVVTAKVPLSMVVLNDFMKRRNLPADLRLRLILPTDGTLSVSLWDAPSAEAVTGWLDENLNQDGSHEVFEVQEDFSWGMAFELGRLRAAEKMAAGGRSLGERLTATAKRAGDGLQQQLEALDQRTHIITAAESAISRVRSGGQVPVQQQPGGGEFGSAASGAGPAPQQTTSAAVAASVTAGLTKAGSTISWLGAKVKGALAVPTAATSATPTSNQSATTAATAALFTSSGGGYGAAADEGRGYDPSIPPPPPVSSMGGAGGEEEQERGDAYHGLLAAAAAQAPTPAPTPHTTAPAPIKPQGSGPAAASPAPPQLPVSSVVAGGQSGAASPAAPAPAPLHPARPTFTLDDEGESPHSSPAPHSHTA